MSRYLPRLLLAAFGLVLTTFAYGLCADSPKAENAGAREFACEILLVESKTSSSVSIEKPEIRTIGGLNFVGGRVFLDSSIPTNDEFVGRQIWVPMSEVTRLIEVESKAKFASRREMVSLMKRKETLEQQLNLLKPDSPNGQRLKDELTKVRESLAKNLGQ